ncbi:M10 family metallopeptidase C-terminal domain-containing protein [Paracoccus caeni]|uniref:M10 family metallopeptidase C-terminal domain-containing protein n=1 Tax=Paracoccus caeni TaxID=657651 RepID=A0A934SFQ1_9RHOB|nr:calcium-binding protein [Paracoccus caeni]MBK4214354.1 M10 family metallopeptidase C-terminal domain-containing protein [Paracoccus caeni]
MAKINAFNAFDQRDFDISFLYSGRASVTFFEGTKFEYAGTTYPAAYEVDWSGDRLYRSHLLGEDFRANDDKRLTGGTVQTYVEAVRTSVFDPFAPAYVNFSISEFSIPATAFNTAMRTAVIADDASLLNRILSGDDVFRLSRSHDRADGKAGNDALYGGLGNDTLIGGAGNDSLAGGDGNDRISLDAGNDRIVGGGGRDVLVATGNIGITVDLAKTVAQDTGYGRDVIIGIEDVTSGSGKDRLLGTDGANALSGGGGDDALQGRGGNDLLEGGGGHDTLEGGDGRDRLEGGAGNDRLAGGHGVDELLGGAGADLFLFRSLTDASVSEFEPDVILDFTQGQDRIDLRQIDASSILSGNNSFQFTDSGKLGTTNAGVVTYVQFDRPGTANDTTVIVIDTDADAAAEAKIRLNGLYDLTADDFFL